MRCCGGGNRKLISIMTNSNISVVVVVSVKRVLFCHHIEE